MNAPKPPRNNLTALQYLAETVSQWVEGVSGVQHVYIFGSRVRGDYRPDSDVDIRIFVEKMKLDPLTLAWWDRQHRENFASLKNSLPGPLGLHLDSPEICDDAILEGGPNRVLTAGKAICVWTEPKAPAAQTGDAQGRRA
jgi:hypothetical protein